MSKTQACDEDRFLKDAANHQMTVIRDDGVHRHLRFKNPDYSAYWFDLITWDGTLCIDGDMGTFVFRRLHDMFEFFRTDREYLTRKGVQLAINPGYWSEKLRAPNSRHAEEYSADSFRQHVKEAYDNWAEAEKPDDESSQTDRDEFASKSAQLWEELESDVLRNADDGDVRAYDAAREFTASIDGVSFDMSECWEWRCREYTFDFLWCCYAIAWGIKAYDDAKTANAPTEQTEAA